MCTSMYQKSGQNEIKKFQKYLKKLRCQICQREFEMCQTDVKNTSKRRQKDIKIVLFPTEFPSEFLTFLQNSCPGLESRPCSSFISRLLLGVGVLFHVVLASPRSLFFYFIHESEVD